MSIKNKATVESYVANHGRALAALENLREFIESMPAPDENDELPNIDYGYVGSFGLIVEMLSDATQIADSMTK